MPSPRFPCEGSHGGAGVLGASPTVGTAMEPSSQPHPRLQVGEGALIPLTKRKGGGEPQAVFWGAAAFWGVPPTLGWGGHFQHPPFWVANAPLFTASLFIFPARFRNLPLLTHVHLAFPAAAATPPETSLGFDRCRSRPPAAAPARSERSRRCDDAHRQLKSVFLFGNKLTAPAVGRGNG